MFKYQLGFSAKDLITNFEGIIVGRVDYITGCNQYLLQPKGKKNKKEGALWFDEHRLELLKTKKLELPKEVPPGACESAPNK